MMRRLVPNIVMSVALSAIPLVAAADEYEDIEKLDPGRRIAEYNQLLIEKPESSEIQFKLGNAYYDEGNPEEAANFYRRAWHAGRDPKAILNLTYVLQELGKRSEAGQEFKKAIDRIPNDALIRSHYGDFLSGGEDETESTALAMEQYRYALHIDDKCVEAHFGMGVLFARSGIFREAVVEWERVVEIDSEHNLAATALQNVSRARSELGR